MRFAAKSKSNFPMYQWPLKLRSQNRHHQPWYFIFSTFLLLFQQCSWCTEFMESWEESFLQRHGKHCGAQGGLFPFTPTHFLPCSTCSLGPRAALTRWHLLSGHTSAADVPLAAFSLPKGLHVQANKKPKSYICEQPKLGFFSFTNMSLHFDTGCLRLLVLQFFTLLRKSLWKLGITTVQ